MEYVGIKDKAVEWDLSEKRVQVLCNENRILGAQKVGNSWIIPFDAKRPADNRIKKDDLLNEYDISAICELLAEDSKVNQEYKIRFELEKNNMLNPVYRLKQIYTDVFILNKYYRIDLIRYIGTNIDEVDGYLKNINSKIVLMELEEKTEINKLILTISRMVKNILELIQNQKINYGIADMNAQNKFNSEHFKLLIEFIEIIVEHHGDEIKTMFDNFMNIDSERKENETLNETM